MPPKGDIRSFFTSLSSKSSSAKPAANGDKEDDTGKRKKKPMVIDDSDSDESFMSSKKKAKKASPKKGSPKKASPKKASPKKVTMNEQPAPFTKIKTEKKADFKETPLKPVDISAVFGSSPIKRSKDGSEKRKRSAAASDEETKTLTKSPEAVPTKKTKVTESPRKEKPNTPSPSKESEKNNVVRRSPRKQVTETVKKEEKRSWSSKNKIKYADETDDEDIVLATPKQPSKTKSKVTRAKQVIESDEDEDVVPATPKQSPMKPVKKEAEKLSKKVESPKKKTPVNKVKEEPMEVEETPKKQVGSPEATASPSIDPLEKRKQHAESYRRFLATHKEGAKNPGCKPVPEGAPNCLSGLTIVVTGVLESLHREEAEELIKKYGGKATKSVSRNTSYILAGDDAGPSKLSKAKDLNVAVISEDDFLNLIATRPAGSGVGSPAPGRGRTPATPKSEKKPARSLIKNEPVEPKEVSPAKKKSPDFKKPTSKSPVKSVPTPSSQPTQPSTSKTPSEPTVPWVDKYKPVNLKQVIGMQGDRSNAKKLVYWLQHWFENHGSGHKKHTRPSPWATNDDGSYFKAALLSGPPGVGKTTTAHLAARELGFDVVEMNASDTRSKRLLHEHVTELLSSKSLASYAHGSQQIENGRKRVLIMDEVDGMAGNEDRGGIQELIGLIKASKVPIVCICNDRQHPKVRSLSNYCYDLKFSKPRVEQIRGAMMSICFKEGLKMKPDALDEIIAGANQDVRQILNHLSILAKSEDQSITSEQAKREASKSKKDFKLGPWDVVRRVFSADEHKGMSIGDKVGLFFQDYSFGPLFVQENYPLVIPHAAKGDAKKTLDLLARTADCMSVTDLIEKTIRSQNAWNLLPVEAMFASVIPGQLMEGHVGGQIQFPSWLGKNSRQNKMDRLLQELQIHMRLRVSGSKRAVNLDYLPMLVDAVVGPLKRDGAAGVEAAVRAMENYDLIREDLDSLLEVAQWPNRPDIMAGVDGKVKAAFTRAYNKEAHLTPYAASQVKVVRSKASAAEDLEGIEGLDGEEAAAVEEEENDDDLAHDAMIKVKKPAKKEPASTGSKKKSESAPGGSGKASRGGGARGRGRGKRSAE